MSKDLFLLQIEGVPEANGEWHLCPLPGRQKTEIEILGITCKKADENQNAV
jgi:hypothetical protein